MQVERILSGVRVSNVQIGDLHTAEIVDNTKIKNNFFFGRKTMSMYKSTCIRLGSW